MIKQLIYALKSGCIKSCLTNTIEIQVGEQVFLLLDREQIPALPERIIATVTNVQHGHAATVYSRQYTFEYDNAEILTAGVSFIEACTIKSVPLCVSCCDLLDARVDVLEGSGAGLVARVAAAEADINALEAKDVVLQAADAALASRVATAETDINALEAKDVVLQNADAALAGRVTAAEADIDALQAGTATLQNADTALAARVTTTESRIANAEADINALELKDVALQNADALLAGRVSTAEADINALELRDTILQTADATLAGRVAILENADTTLAGRVSLVESRPATTLTNNASPFSWNPTTQTGNIPQSSSIVANTDGTFTFNNGTGGAGATIDTKGGISSDANNELTLGADLKAKFVSKIATAQEASDGTDNSKIMTPLRVAQEYLRKAGGVMTGVLTLAANPTLAMHAATKSYVDALLSGDGMPVGAVVPFSSSAVPQTWLFANGQEVSRTEYAELFALLGSPASSGNGSTTFNVPDLRGEFIRGWDGGRGVDVGRAIGTAQGDEFKNHAHRSQYANITPASFDYTNQGVEIAASGLDWSYPTTATGGNETRPRNVALMYCIKAKTTL
jgi:microcystin-dependent protein